MGRKEKVYVCKYQLTLKKRNHRLWLVEEINCPGFTHEITEIPLWCTEAEWRNMSPYRREKIIEASLRSLFLKPVTIRELAKEGEVVLRAFGFSSKTPPKIRDVYLFYEHKG